MEDLNPLQILCMKCSLETFLNNRNLSFLTRESLVREGLVLKNQTIYDKSQYMKHGYYEDAEKLPINFVSYYEQLVNCEKIEQVQGVIQTIQIQLQRLSDIQLKIPNKQLQSFQIIKKCMRDYQAKFPRKL